MFCRKCGNQFDDSLDFCPKCNEPVPEAAKRNRTVSASATKKCPQCLTDNKPEARFCAGCGFDMSAAEQPGSVPPPPAPPVQDGYGIPDYGAPVPEGAPAAKSGVPVKAIVIGVAALVLVLVLLLVFMFSGGSNEPVPALLKAAENLSEEIKDAKGMHIEAEVDGDEVAIDYQLNIGKKEFVFLMDADGEEVGGYIFEDGGRVAMKYGSDYYTEKISKSDAETIWTAVEGKDYEDNELLTTIFDKKEVNKAIKSLEKGLASKDFQTDFADALEIEYDKKGGEYTYSAELDVKNVCEALEVLLDMVEERTEDYAERELEDFLDDAADEIKEMRSEGGNMSLGDIEWVIKKGKLQGFEYEYEYYDDYYEETEKYNISGELKYGFGGLESVEISGNFDGDKFSVEISDIDKVGDVKDLMSKSMLKELKLDD